MIERGNAERILPRLRVGNTEVSRQWRRTVFKLERPDPLPAPPPPGTFQNVQSGADTRMSPLNRGKIAIEVEYAETWVRSIAIRPLNDNE